MTRLTWALIALTLCIYAQTFQHGFVVVDVEAYITNNEIIKKGFTLQGLGYAFASVHTGDWQPLVWISWMLDCQLFGMNAGAHHLMNVTYHLINVLLLFWVLHAMTGSIWKSWFVAAFWAVHPTHVESVAWVAERKDTLSAMFWLLTMVAYTRYVKLRAAMKWVVIFYLLAILSKPMVVTLPLILLMMDHWPFGRYEKEGIKKILQEKIPLFFLSAFSSLMAYQANAYIGGVKKFVNFPFHLRLANAIYSYGAYLKKTLLPIDLAYFYPYPNYRLAEPVVLICLVLLLVVSVFCLRQFRERPYFMTGWFWFIGTLVPVIGLMQVGDQGMADRYVYIPHIGLFIALIWGLSELAVKLKMTKPILAGLMILFLSSYSALGYAQTSTWKNNYTLNEHALKVNPDNFFVQQMLGFLYSKDNLLEKAAYHYAQAMRINPRNNVAVLNLASVLYRLDDRERAKKLFESVLETDPKNHVAVYNLGVIEARNKNFGAAARFYYQALLFDPTYVKAHQALAELLIRVGRYPEAVHHIRRIILLRAEDPVAQYLMGIVHIQTKDYEKPIKMDYVSNIQAPDFLDPLKSISEIFYFKGDLNKAHEHLSQAIQLRPKFTQALVAQGLLYAHQKKYDEAINSLLQAIESNPKYSASYSHLGKVFDLSGRDEEALQYYLKAIEANPNRARPYKRLGDLFAKRKQWLQAVEAYQKALDLVPSYASVKKALVYAQEQAGKNN